ncbi:MAG: DUF560 domain-containing protein [Alphaproteobacteria bacterium]|nr:MAG: DUF560 domain-containing protein [Alphaproteobacteria bacterium]
MTAFLLAALAGAALAPAPATAPAPTRIESLSAAQLFAIADGARAEGRVDDALVFYEALTRDPDPEVRAEARFRRGMTLAEAKRYREAAESFRALLDEKPGTARVRLELARVLALLVAAALRSSRPIGGSFEIALAPDSNVNRATAARTLDTIIAPLVLSEDARARSGLGLKAGGQLYARVPVGSRLAVVPRLSGLGRFYRAERFDDASASALLGVEWQGGKDRVTGSAGAGWRWYGLSPYARTQTLAADWIHAAGRTTQFVTSLAASRARYVRNTLQDGEIYAAAVSIEHALNPGRGFTLTASADRQTARDPGYATASGGLALLGWQEWGKVTLYASAALRRTEGDARLVLFTDRRREWLYQAATGATFRQVTFHGLAPTLRVTWERNVSTVGLYDYSRLATEIGVTRAF